MRVLIADDEAAARGLLRELLEAHAGLEIVGEARNGVETVTRIHELQPDLVFLDIQMPVLDGFEVLAQLIERPMIVFCTAYDQYAIQAFEAEALDYLLKPVEEERLAKCLKRVRNHWEKLERLSRERESSRGMEKIVCQRNGGHHLVWLKDVVLLRKDGRYTALVTQEGSEYMTELPIGHFGERMKDPAFFQLNRGLIVRQSVIKSFKVLPSGAGECTLTRHGDVPISRSRISAFKDWLLSN